MKKILHTYTFIPNENKIVIKGVYDIKRFLLITNVTQNKTIFTFNSQITGLADFSKDFINETTTLELNYNCSAMDATDTLQIFIETDEVIFEPSETFVDPVSKIRVSNPENLIDTDFEYGLQSTKWETLELSNNIPSFYTSDADLPLSKVEAVNAIAGSNVITVINSEAHNLAPGNPIDVRGLTSRTAEGKFLIKNIPNENVFTYEANGSQTTTGNLGSVYTAITPGQFYSGSQIPFKPDVGIITDGQTPSTITVTTPEAHGFEVNSNFYLINSIGTKRVTLGSDLTLTDNAPDNRPFVDVDNFRNFTLPINESLTETKQMRSTYYKKISYNDVDVPNSRILWTNHRLRNNDTLVYIPSAGDEQIAGLQRFQVYYVRNPQANSFQLSLSYNGDVITFGSTGTYERGRGGLHLCYEVYYHFKGANTHLNRLHTTFNQLNTGSGWDLISFGANGIAGTNPQYKIIFSPSGYNITSNALSLYYTSARHPDMTMGESGNTPGLFNFIEDYTRYQSYAQYQYTNFNVSGSIFNHTDFGGVYSTAYSYTPRHRNIFVMFLNVDEEADTFYVKDHGLTTGTTVGLSVASGPNVLVSTSNTSLYNENLDLSFGNGKYTFQRVSNDRFKLVFSGNSRIAAANGDYNLIVEIPNPTRNTFYYPRHGFSTGDAIRFETAESGIVPQTNTGKTVFDSRINEGTIESAWIVLKNSMDNYTFSLAGHQNLVLNGAKDSYQPINSGVASGTSLLNSYNLSQTPYLRSIFRLDQIANPTNDLYYNRQSSTQVKDAGEGSVFVDQGWSYIGTDFVQNTSVPHYSLLWGYAHPTNQDVTEFRVYSRTSALQMNTFGETDISYDLNGDNSWRASYAARYATSPTAAGYVEFNIVIWNEENWTPEDPDPIYQFVINGNNGAVYSQPINYNSTYWGKPIHFRTFFMLSAGSTFDNTSVQQLATKLVTDLANNFEYPELINEHDAFIQVVGDNRFRLRDEFNLEYDLTSTGSPVLTFNQQGLVGLSDGAYRVKAVPSENTFLLELPFDSPQSSKSFYANQISNNLMTIVNGHFFLPGTPVIYNRNGNTAIAGLTDDQQYYVYVADELRIGLANSYDNAIQGQILPIIAAGDEEHLLKFPLINGRTTGIGTVSVISGSKKVLGSNGSLFKRYFKVGDNIGIKNNTISPPTIETFVVAAIADDSNMELDDIVSFTTNNTKYFLETKLYTRPDGYSVHRPFDGGVEIAAGTAPYSQVIRQTRKYFRYQSGKGIQTSIAINFNPPIQFETLEGSTETDLISRLLSEEEKSINISKTPINSAYVINSVENPTIQLIRGVTYILNIDAEDQNFRIQTTSGIYNEDNQYTSGIFNAGSDNGAIVFSVPLNAPNTLYYISQNSPNMTGAIQIIDDFIVPYYVARGTTRYPHRLFIGSKVTVSGASDDTYNGRIELYKVLDDYTFEYLLPADPQTSVPAGIIQYNMNGYTGSVTRAGMFDFQNGFFFEFDGNTLYAVRRSSTQQLSGTATVIKKSNLIVGLNTNFSGQLVRGDYIVIRGQSYKVTKIKSRNEIAIQPEYKGVNATNVVITKTVDTRVPQTDWNIDRADGEGQSSFKLNLNKIQMVYMDYSWYGAGKIRFGFKDQQGHVKYVHEFIHNNKLDESYMRSGNMVARYEISNDANPEYAPTLFHWGTSVIMDGKYDDDKAYLFTADSRPLLFTNGAALTATTNADSELVSFYQSSLKSNNWYVKLLFPSTDSDKFSSGTKLYTSDNSLNGIEVAYTQFSGNSIAVFIFVQTSIGQPIVYPTINNNTLVNIGSASFGSTSFNLGTEIIPLITIRLAPSVDSNLTGALGARDIINRMQLKLNEVGLILTHDCEVKLILNGDLSTVNWENVAPPSLSELLRHDSGDKVVGGTEIFSFRSSGGSSDNNGVRFSATSNFQLNDIIDLGNSILGGDGTYPNGPDILTIAVKVVDTKGISASSPFKASSRITWSESQA